jgi:hypothetical protein
MPRHSWTEIRGTAAPETLARAALKTKAMLASMDQQDGPDGSTSALAIKSMNLEFTREEIVSFVREGRDRPE